MTRKRNNSREGANDRERERGREGRKTEGESERDDFHTTSHS